MLKTPEAQRRLNLTREAWDKENTKQVKFKLNLRTDADILEKLASVDNVQGYFKSLIRADIESSKENKSKEDKSMKKYHIKPEYYDFWFGKESPDPDYVVTQDEMENFSREWDKPVEELMEQLIEID